MQFALAFLGVILGTASLAWQAASHFLSGARIAMDLRVVDKFDLDLKRAREVKTRWHYPMERRIRHDSLFVDDVLRLEIRTRGRLPAAVFGVWVKIDDRHGGTMTSSWREDIPARLDVGGAPLVFNFTRKNLFWSQPRDVVDVRPYVELGDGRILRGHLLTLSVVPLERWIKEGED